MVKFLSAGTCTEQGVLHPGPMEVTASAPGGVESICNVTCGGMNKSVDEPPARQRPAATIRTTRMIHPSLLVWLAHYPHGQAHDPLYKAYGSRHLSATGRRSILTDAVNAISYVDPYSLFISAICADFYLGHCCVRGGQVS